MFYRNSNFTNDTNLLKSFFCDKIVYMINNNPGWGKVSNTGAEIWDTDPVFKGDEVTWQDKLKLLFYPKKFFLYRHIYKDAIKKLKKRDLNQPYRILDVGCGTGASIIDLKKLLGKRVDVVGVDVVGLQIDLAKEKIKKNDKDKFQKSNLVEKG